MRNKITVLLIFFSIIPNAFGWCQPANKSSYMLPSLYQDNGDNFVVIAHRGASAYYPENTMPAFRGAVEMKAEMIELDVMMSRDGIPVVFHDAGLDDHTDGEGRLKDFTLRELKKLDAGSWFDAEFAGVKIPTLDEVLSYAKGKIAVNIEIKTEAVGDSIRGGVEEACLELVRKHGMEDHVIFSSFDYRAVSHLKTLAPEIPAALLFNKKQSEGVLPSELVAKYGADAFNCSFKELNKKRLGDLRQHAIPVFVYTVDNPKRMRKLIDKKVTGIFTNKPDLLWDVVREVEQE